MSVEQTKRTLDHYFGLMGRDEDFATCFTADVTWVIADTGTVIDGPDAVTRSSPCTREWGTLRVATPSLVTATSTSREIVLPPTRAATAESTTASPTT